MRATLLTYVLLAPSVALLLRYLTFHFDSFTLCFARFLAGGVFLLGLGLVRQPQALKALVHSRRIVGAMGLLALLMAVSNVLAVEGIAKTDAATASLFRILGMPLTVAAAMWAFRDERALARSPFFLMGSVLVLAGGIGIALAGASAPGGSSAYLAGTVFLSGAIVLACAHGLLIKRLTREHSPLALAGICACLTSVLFLLAALFVGDLSRLTSAPPRTVALLFGSGVYGLVVGMGLAFVVIRDVGISLFRVANLGVPVLVAVLAYLVLGEALTLTQIAFGGLLLLGCACALRATRLPSPVPGKHAG